LAEVKRPGRIVENPTPSSDGVKEEYRKISNIPWFFMDGYGLHFAVLPFRNFACVNVMRFKYLTA
jgi:hypothetical protein